MTRPRFTLADALDWLDAHQGDGEWCSYNTYCSGSVAQFRAYLQKRDPDLLTHIAAMADQGYLPGMRIDVEMAHHHTFGVESWWCSLEFGWRDHATLQRLAR